MVSEFHYPRLTNYTFFFSVTMLLTVFALGEREAIGGTDVRQAHQVTRESGRGGTLTSWGLGRVCRKSVLGGGCQ